MYILLALLLLLAPAPPPCQVLHAPIGTVAIRASSEQLSGVAGALYTTRPVLATDGVITDTATLAHGFVIAAPPVPIRVDAPYSYTFYVCQSSARPGVVYLPLI